MRSAPALLCPAVLSFPLVCGTPTPYGVLRVCRQERSRTPVGTRWLDDCSRTLRFFLRQKSAGVSANARFFFTFIPFHLRIDEEISDISRLCQPTFAAGPHRETNGKDIPPDGLSVDVSEVKVPTTRGTQMVYPLAWVPVFCLDPVARSRVAISVEA